MSAKKRWVLVVDEDTHSWIKHVAKDIGTSGQALFMEMLRQFRAADLSGIKNQIHSQHVKEQLERIEHQKAELERKEQQLKKEMADDGKARK